ncbi:MAG: CoA-binding protein [Flavobacteriales bacterium]|nr:CoA-binding protein [Flavobacteriales bacterium]MCB9449027.1 CoA-binding protein [Flavobacteriales bacterium]
MKVLVLGASLKSDRYSYKAVERLRAAGYETAAVGMQTGAIGDVEVLTGRPEVPDVDTISLYVGQAHQPEWYDYIFSLKPRRIIMNPGTENPELMQMAAERGVETEMACTLVLLATHQFGGPEKTV